MNQIGYLGCFMVLSRPPTPNLTASGTTSATLRFLPKDLRRAGGVAGVEAHVGRELEPRLCYDTYALSEAHTEGVTSDFLMAAWLSSEIRCSFRARLCWLWIPLELAKLNQQSNLR